jgi:hypothetical protein
MGLYNFKMFPNCVNLRSVKFSILEEVIQLINIYQIDFNYTKQWDNKIAAVNKRGRLEFPRPLQTSRTVG